MGEHKIVINLIMNNWLIGTIDGMEFEAKVYDVGSQFGIDDGRVSKLAVYRTKPRGEIIAYERGWDKYPKPEHEDILDALLSYCAGLPKAEDWRLRNGKVVPAKGVEK